MGYGIENMNKVLIINICKEKLHYFEFVKPIEDILKNNRIKFKTLNYKKINRAKLMDYGKIIICGTSLKDDNYLNTDFSWIKNTSKPVLGICAGMQIICLVFKEKLKKKIEIGFYKENFKRKFLGLRGEKEVYHIHNNYTSLPKDFEKFTNSKIPQAIKHKDKEIYGALFHPEVRNKELILNFVNKNY